MTLFLHWHSFLFGDLVFYNGEHWQIQKNLGYFLWSRKSLCGSPFSRWDPYPHSPHLKNFLDPWLVCMPVHMWQMHLCNLLREYFQCGYYSKLLLKLQFLALTISDEHDEGQCREELWHLWFLTTHAIVWKEIGFKNYVMLFMRCTYNTLNDE